MIRVYAIFHHFFNIFCFLDSCLDLIEFFQVHDMTINFFFAFSISRSHSLSFLGNNACHRWPSKLKHLFSYEDCFERLVFWFKVVQIISVQREDYGSKVFQRNGQFWSTCPKASIKVISKYHDLGILFGLKGLAGLKLQQVLMHTKLPNINFLQKLVIFCCLIFEEFEK